MKVVLAVLCLALSLQWGLVSPIALARGPVRPPRTAAQLDLSTPEKTVEAFFAALNRADVRGMVPCVLEAADSSELDGLQKDFERSPMHGKIFLSNIKAYKDEAGTEALVAFQIELRAKADEGDAAGKTSEVLVVRKTGEEWKIVAPKPESFEGRSARQGPSDANTIVMLIRYPDALRKARNGAQTALSLSNVKQIALGLLMYVQDYDEVFVPNAAKYKEVVRPYIKNDSVFTSPLDPPGTLSYKFNPQLARKSLAVFERPADTVMIFEGEYKKLLFRYDGKAVIGFMDGHVKMVTPEEATKLRWTP